jgi:hypothetical protein
MENSASLVLNKDARHALRHGHKKGKTKDKIRLEVYGWPLNQPQDKARLTVVV